MKFVILFVFSTEKAVMLRLYQQMSTDAFTLINARFAACVRSIDNLTVSWQLQTFSRVALIRAEYVNRHLSLT